MCSGELDTAEALLGSLDDTRHVGTASLRAVTMRARARVLAARGQTAAALVELEAALALHHDTAMPFEAARTSLVDGQVRRRAKQWGSARSSLEAAIAAFEKLGAGQWAALARSELSRVGGRPPASLDLTPTEQRVAMVVATGSPTKEAAAGLYTSPRTVEWHLTKVYRKLGVRNRAALAAALNAA